MKNICFAVAFFIVLLTISGCGFTPGYSSDNGGLSQNSFEITTQATVSDLSRYYEIVSNSDFTWNCKITDISGKTLYSDVLEREPHIEVIGDDILKLWVQTGTGQATRWAIYYSIKESLISQKYQYPVTENEKYTAGVVIEDEKVYVDVITLFGGETIKRIKLEAASAHIDPVLSAKIAEDSKTITIEYRNNDDETVEINEYALN